MKLLYLVTRPRPFFESQVTVLRDRGHSITVLEVPGREKQTDSRGIADYLRFYPGVLSESMKEYDLIHANYGNTLPFALFQPIRPVVVTFWGSDLMGPAASVLKPLATRVDEVIFPSPVMTETYDGDYTVVPFGVDTELFCPIDKQKARAELGWNQDATIALFPYARSRAVKNYSLAENIAETVSHNVEIKTIHDVAYTRVPLYMNASDLVLLTSERESGPMVVKEAALCNVPVVSTNVGFVEDVLSDVTNSFVCDSEQELRARVQQVLETGEKSDGRQQIKDAVCLEEMGRQLCDVYERALE